MEVKNITVLGLGTIGYQIAMLAAQNGHKVTVRDINDEVLEYGKKNITRSFKMFSVDKGKMTQEEADEIYNSITFTTSMENAAKDADLVIESVPEEMELKKQIFKELDKICRTDTILATNSSALSILEISSLINRKDKCAGFHFANPVALIRSIEIIRSFMTSDETIDTLKNLAIKWNYEFRLVNDLPGQSGRLLCVLINEAIKMIGEGFTTPEGIDEVSRMLGHRFPIMEVADINLEIPYKGLLYLQQEYGDGYRPHPLLKKMVLAGKLGKKTGEGFYKYDENGKKIS
jgi:3-hydroxybutyryl-CoA dehydrogenase